MSGGPDTHQERVTVVEEQGDTLEPQRTLDADLRHLADPAPRPRVSPPARRRSSEVPLLYVGRTRGGIHDGAVDLVVPDRENDGRVAELQEALVGIDEKSRHDAWAKEAKETRDAGDDPSPYIPLREDLHLTGPSYHFTRGEATNVDEEDVDFFLTHPTLHFERSR